MFYDTENPCRMRQGILKEYIKDQHEVIESNSLKTSLWLSRVMCYRNLSINLFQTF